MSVPTADSDIEQAYNGTVAKESAPLADALNDNEMVCVTVMLSDPVALSEKLALNDCCAATASDPVALSETLAPNTTNADGVSVPVADSETDAEKP